MSVLEIANSGANLVLDRKVDFSQNLECGFVDFYGHYSLWDLQILQWPKECRTLFLCVPQIACNKYQVTLQTDQLHNNNTLPASAHAIGAKVFMDLQDDDDGDSDDQECWVKACFNPEPEQSDDESSSSDDYHRSACARSRMGPRNL